MNNRSKQEETAEIAKIYESCDECTSFVVTAGFILISLASLWYSKEFRGATIVATILAAYIIISRTFGDISAKNSGAVIKLAYVLLTGWEYYTLGPSETPNGLSSWFLVFLSWEMGFLATLFSLYPSYPIEDWFIKGKFKISPLTRLGVPIFWKKILIFGREEARIRYKGKVYSRDEVRIETKKHGIHGKMIFGDGSVSAIIPMRLAIILKELLS